MELNREQIIKALECCGTSDKSCSYCPLAKDYSPCSKTMADNALSLIKELTAENKLLNVELGNANSEILRLIEEKKELTEEVASWKAIAEGYQKQFEDCADDRAKLTEENERLRGCVMSEEQVRTIATETIKQGISKIKAATVRKYREQLHRAFAHSDSKDKFNKGVFLEMVDLIAKEMSEGEK